MLDLLGHLGQVNQFRSQSVTHFDEKTCNEFVYIRISTRSLLAFENKSKGPEEKISYSRNRVSGSKIDSA